MGVNTIDSKLLSHSKGFVPILTGSKWFFQTLTVLTVSFKYQLSQKSNCLQI